ncbi:3-methyladenine DNA glycosylase Mpg [Bradyrhizobium sp. USDA 4449]
MGSRRCAAVAVSRTCTHCARAPGKLTEALGITIAHNTLPLDRPPIALHARTADVEVATGIRIGITKAVELPWRYGVRGSKFLSKPFPK